MTLYFLLHHPVASSVVPSKAESSKKFKRKSRSYSDAPSSQHISSGKKRKKKQKEDNSIAEVGKEKSKKVIQGKKIKKAL